MPLKIYNSLTNRIEEMVPLDPQKKTIKMYNCGPTVYDYAHIGNFRSFLMADLLRRVLELNGYEVEQVMNLTDVGHMTQDSSLEEGGEDKMQKALQKNKNEKTEKSEKKSGYREKNFKSVWDVAEYYIAAFSDDFKALNLTPPRHFPRATDYIATMVEMIQKLMDNGVAYQGSDSAIYFDITKFPQYGKLSNNTIESLRQGASGRTSESETQAKRHPFDFALWKQDENHQMKWETPWGTGFPGWHIECSAMSYKLLGETIDIHTGGEDNRFPHHECEIAQSESFSGKPFVKYWVHAKHLLVDGQVMSKSKGNFYTIHQLREAGHHPLAIRWLLLSGQYTQQLNFTIEGLKAAQKNIEKLVEFKKSLEGMLADSGQKPPPSRADVSPLCQKAQEDFLMALNNNLNISEAIAGVFTLSSSLKKYFPLSAVEAQLALNTLSYFDRVLGVLETYRPLEKELNADLEEKVNDLIQQRNLARQQKQWARADEIRQELLQLEIEIVDSPSGTTWKKI